MVKCEDKVNSVNEKQKLQICDVSNDRQWRKFNVQCLKKTCTLNVFKAKLIQ